MTREKWHQISVSNTYGTLDDPVRHVGDSGHCETAKSGDGSVSTPHSLFTYCTRAVSLCLLPPPTRHDMAAVRGQQHRIRTAQHSQTILITSSKITEALDRRDQDSRVWGAMRIWLQVDTVQGKRTVA
ncbi:hypothetical protein IG631_22534 [Alternaria alternata]|nr:hypothetical protein IG631_22534 [Alternaria alternata]